MDYKMSVNAWNAIPTITDKDLEKRGAIMDQRLFITSWNEIHTIVDDAMEKHDRSVSIYISGDGSISANVYPWPNLEDLYDMYKEGMISLDEFREKSGLQMIAKEDIDKR